MAQSLRFNSIRLFKNIRILRNYKVSSEKLFSFNQDSIIKQRASLNYINKIYELAKVRGVKKFIILSIPSKNDFKEYEKNKNYILSRWENELIKLDKTNKSFYYVNGLEIIKKINPSFYEKLFYTCDGHWSPFGSSLYSSFIYEKFFK